MIAVLVDSLIPTQLNYELIKEANKCNHLESMTFFTKFTTIPFMELDVACMRLEKFWFWDGVVITTNSELSKIALDRCNSPVFQYIYDLNWMFNGSILDIAKLRLNKRFHLISRIPYNNLIPDCSLPLEKFTVKDFYGLATSNKII